MDSSAITGLAFLLFIAGALTYVRRQWGNAAPAVDPAVVRDVRAANAGRTRPWTDGELLGLIR